MRIKDYKCKCGCEAFFFSDNGNQKGIYCSRCGMWPKWADKNEQNLRMKQESVLDKIRAEIGMYEADCRLQGGTDECEKCNSNIFGSIYRIIDKYRAESEE